MKSLVGFLIALLWAQAVTAETFNSAIQSLTIPDGWQHQMDPNSGTHAVFYQNETQLIVSWLPQTDPVNSLNSLQAEVGWQTNIESTTLAGQPSYRVVGSNGGYETSIRITELNDGYAMTILNTANSIDALQKTLSTVVASLRIAPKQLPNDLIDSFRTQSDFSSSYSADLGNVSFTETTTLLSNGTYIEGSNVTASSSSATGISSGEVSGLWQVRGNLIYFSNGKEYLSHYRFESFSNGLELYSNEGDPWLWVRL